MEDCELSVFESLSKDDIVFIDNSHRAFQNSDVTVFFTEIFPRLPDGMVVGVHDIFLPCDYPESWANRYYSEQYLLAVWLLANATNPKVLWPLHHTCNKPESREHLQGFLVKHLPPEWSEALWGGTFWMQMLKS